DAWPVFEVFALGAYDFSVVDWTGLKTVLDCGAHVGSFSIWVANRSQCRIVAIEPNPVALNLCERNLRGAGVAVSLVRAALAGHRGKRTLNRPSVPGISSISQAGTGQSLEVETTTLDDVLEQNHLDVVDLMKMDIEGAEQEVFASLSETGL